MAEIVEGDWKEDTRGHFARRTADREGESAVADRVPT
jgi:hypothetical protein